MGKEGSGQGVGGAECCVLGGTGRYFRRTTRLKRSLTNSGTQRIRKRVDELWDIVL